MLRFAQHESVVNGFAGIGAVLRPAFGQFLPWQRSARRLLCGDDSRSQIAAATDFSDSGSHRGNRRECFLRLAFSSAVDDTHWQSDAPHRECAEVSATRENPLEVAKATGGPGGKSPRVPLPGQ